MNITCNTWHHFSLLEFSSELFLQRIGPGDREHGDRWGNSHIMAVYFWVYATMLGVVYIVGT